jgi:release factor glutamine methyltransferase
MTVTEWLKEAEQRLRFAGCEEARTESWMILSNYLGVDRAWFVTHGQDLLMPTDDLEELLARREARQPLAYILGYREFYGRRFHMNSSVLVPRQETETLVEAALYEISTHLKPSADECLPDEKPQGPLTLLDLGTGSGCVGITLALERSDVVVTVSDISQDALNVARENAKELGVEVEAVLSDAFSALDGRVFNYIVSNPPYVARGAILAPEIAIFEPEVALYSGPSGFEFYERLAAQAKGHLAPKGRLLVECGDRQAEDVMGLFEGEGWTHKGVWKDLLGIKRVAVFGPPGED